MTTRPSRANCTSSWISAGADDQVDGAGLQGVKCLTVFTLAQAAGQEQARHPVMFEVALSVR